MRGGTSLRLPQSLFADYKVRIFILHCLVNNQAPNGALSRLVEYVGTYYQQQTYNFLITGS